MDNKDCIRLTQSMEDDIAVAIRDAFDKAWWSKKRPTGSEIKKMMIRYILEFNDSEYKISVN